jgi:hypothetical protein
VSKNAIAVTSARTSTTRRRSTSAPRTHRSTILTRGLGERVEQLGKRAGSTFATPSDAFIFGGIG